MSVKRKSENGNEMAEVLADQDRYEHGYKHPFAAQPGDTGATLREDEGQHSEQEHEVQDGSDSISDGNSNSAAPERFSADYDDFLLANINTKYKTNSDIKLFYMWAKENSEHRQVQDIPPAELDSLLARMYVGLRKKDGSEYEPDTLTSLQNSIDRHIKSLKLHHCIKTDDTFSNSRRVLKCKRKSLKAMGKGIKSAKGEVFTEEEIQTLYQKNVLGTGNPESILHTVWVNNSVHFGLKGRREHTNLLWGDIKLKETSDGKEYLEFTEWSSKTKSGMKQGDVRIAWPKMFAQKDSPHCPIRVYKEYRARRPADTNIDIARFYLRPISSPSSRTWFSHQPIGKEKLGKILSDISKKGGLMVNDQPTILVPVTLEENRVPEKRLKLLETIQRSQQEMRVQIQNTTSDISPFNHVIPVISFEALKGNQTVLPNSNTKVVPPQVETCDEEELSEVPNTIPDTRNSKYTHKAGPDTSYMFPEGAKAEIVITYGDRIVEKKHVPEEVVKVVNNMLRGDYSCLTKEAQRILPVAPSAGQLADNDEEKDSFNTRMTLSSISSSIPESEKKKQINCIKDAKSEIFRTLSMLSVCKNRFKSLLKWLKTLKLEDIKNGKYMLSAGTAIDGTKYAMSSTFVIDEDNMLRQEQSYKPYGSTTHNKGPNEGDTAVKLTMPTFPESTRNQIMFLRQHSNSSISNPATPVLETAPGVTIVPTTKVPVPVQPLQVSVQSSQAMARSHPTLATVLKSYAQGASCQWNMQSTEERLSPFNKSSTESEGYITVKTEEILSPLNNPSKEMVGNITVKTEERLSPFNKPSTESQGYITVKTEKSLSPLNASSTESESYITVKTEPLDYDSETNDETMEFDCTVKPV